MLASTAMSHIMTLLSRHNITDELIPVSGHQCRRLIVQSSCITYRPLTSSNRPANSQAVMNHSR